MRRKLLDILACPIDKFYPLRMMEFSSNDPDVVVDGVLLCDKCGRFYPIIDEIPVMLPDDLRNKKDEPRVPRKVEGAPAEGDVGRGQAREPVLNEAFRKFIYEYQDGLFVSVSTIDPKQLKKIRVQLGITQSELAKAAGVSQSLIAKLESGLVDPSFSTMKSISEALRSHIRMEGKKAADVMSSPVASVQSNVSIADSIDLMKKNNISQLPVYTGSKLAGSITENQIVALLSGADEP